MQIVGIVAKSSVPPTLESHPDGMIVRFHKCGPILLRCSREVLLGVISAGNEVKPYPQFRIKVGKNRVTINLSRPERGNGQIVVKRGEFLDLLRSV